MVALQVPEWAATEIRRVAGHPQMVQVCASPNPLPFPFGHPIYDPVHRACAETGLPFGIHTLGDGYTGALASATAGGAPTLYLEFHTSAAQAVQTHLASFIFHGVFDRYPTFKLALLESGVGWIPPVVRRLDLDFKGLRREVPWCKRLPSEQFLEQVLVSSQPIDAESTDDASLQALDAMGAEDVLAFASDYPHWDTDVPARTAALLPAHWRDKVLRENACRFYGLSIPVAA
jgi:predicted TIM-barrel fold metal-dependent hydrolase